MKETVKTQVRLLLERQTRELAEYIQPKLPAGTAFLLFLADFGKGGNTAYVANCDRADAIKLVVEWLDRQDENADAPMLRELVLSAGHLVGSIADATGYAGSLEDPGAFVEHCRELREKAERKA